MTKPKPLNLKEWIQNVNFKYDVDDLGHERQMFISKKAFEDLRQRIRSSCEFFMEYYDNPKLLAQDFPELKEEIEKAGGHKLPETDNVAEHFVFDKHFDYDSYNVWLFKLAFHDVFENEKSGDENGVE